MFYGDIQVHPLNWLEENGHGAYEKNSASLTGKTISFARLVRKKMDMENMKKFVCLTGKKYHFPILL